MTREERKIISLVHFCGFSRIISNSESQYLKCGPGENGNVRPSICWYYSVDVNGLSVWTKIRSGGTSKFQFNALFENGLIENSHPPFDCEVCQDYFFESKSWSCFQTLSLKVALYNEFEICFAIMFALSICTSLCTCKVIG